MVLFLVKFPGPRTGGPSLTDVLLSGVDFTSKKARGRNGPEFSARAPNVLDPRFGLNRPEVHTAST